MNEQLALFEVEEPKRGPGYRSWQKVREDMQRICREKCSERQREIDHLMDAEFGE